MSFRSIGNIGNDLLSMGEMMEEQEYYSHKQKEDEQQKKNEKEFLETQKMIAELERCSPNNKRVKSEIMDSIKESLNPVTPFVDNQPKQCVVISEKHFFAENLEDLSDIVDIVDVKNLLIQRNIRARLKFSAMDSEKIALEAKIKDLESQLVKKDIQIEELFVTIDGFTSKSITPTP